MTVSLFMTLKTEPMTLKVWPTKVKFLRSSMSSCLKCERRREPRGSTKNVPLSLTVSMGLPFASTAPAGVGGVAHQPAVAVRVVDREAVEVGARILRVLDRAERPRPRVRTEDAAPGWTPLVLGHDTGVLLLEHVESVREVGHPEQGVGGAVAVDERVLEDVVRVFPDAGDVEAAVVSEALGGADVELVGVRRLERRVELIAGRAARGLGRIEKETAEGRA